ncbi:hypothetical protein SAMN04487988_11272 [Algoriphagus hitonicola]|uniref:Uncharacterized protein n=1 Tax=Algoriphagus hitonicola TaxID=435880 RepID=A0A1I2WER2_9BACT|nr:hypothetical protein SAMN04487988_11272 [Algoriphagus hitonicola]
MKKLNLSADLSLRSTKHEIYVTSKEADVLEVRVSGKSALYIPFSYVKLFVSNREIFTRFEQQIIFFQNDKQFLRIEEGKLVYKDYLTLIRYFFKSLFRQ